ncbi:MAG: type II CRISPR-associated endonuclease Cas1 [Bacteroidales bacterium]|nr:type II CRISPR-associated endonuclease Cas1 [Bacteroidales bacterium]
MIKRTLYIANQCYLRVQDKQLVIKLKEGEAKTVPIEDIGFIVLEHPQISITLPVLSALNDNNVAVIVCNEKHVPHAMLLNLDSHHIQSELFRNQIETSEPLKKNLWKQTVESKIKNQYRLLNKLGKSNALLKSLSGNVKSGDSDNREGVAARFYWEQLFGKAFIRDRYGEAPNPLLNYGYILLRSAVARALAGSGLLATLGIHHRNRYNAFCLADDIMEPYRPFVDEIVYDIDEKYPEANILCTEHKTELLRLMAKDVLIGKRKSPLMLALTQTTASLARCFAGKEKKIEYPELV